MNIQKNTEYFRYLFDLQSSERIDISNAAPCLRHEFIELDKDTIKEILDYWINNHKKISDELGLR